MKSEIKRWVGNIMLVAIGVFAGGVMQSSNTALGEVQSGPPPVSFKTGGQLSVPILQDIATTLRQMDGRLERLELVAKKMQTRTTP